MIRQAHLDVYDLTLTAKAPVFVGSGKSYMKKEYVYLPPTLSRSPEAKVMILNEAALFGLLVERGKEDRYVSFMLGGQSDMYRFLFTDCHLTMSEIAALSRYTVGVGDALPRGASLKEIHAFTRNGRGEAYIPGSSVKGALRTVILTDMVLNDTDKPAYNAPGRFPEGEYLHTLPLKKSKSGLPADDAVNSIMRGLYVSDSQPIDDSSFILAGKTDADINGATHTINLCRECIKPGTEVRFKLTLDRSVLKDRVTADTLKRSIEEFDKFYEKSWLSHFKLPYECAEVSYSNAVLLGGGAGYAAKTLTYPYFGEEAGVAQVAAIMNKNPNGNRNSVIFPRVTKLAKYRGKLYPYGLCEVRIS